MNEHMKTVPDFEDILVLFEKHSVRYLVIGGVAFVFHVKPRYTKDLDIWVDSARDNVMRANQALAEFGSPHLMDAGNADQVLQIGVPPNRVDLLMQVTGPTFGDAWETRVRAQYGSAEVNWIGLESLIDIKGRIDVPRHQTDAMELRMVRDMRARKTHATSKGRTPPRRHRAKPPRK